MANAYNNPNFEIDTNCNIADLITLKGAPIAVTDWIYGFEAPTLTCEQDFDFCSFYFGDNVAGTATKKTFHVVINAGVTATFHSATFHDGFKGEGTTSTVIIRGKATWNTPDKGSNYSIRECAIDAAGGEIEHANYLYMKNANNDFSNCTFTDNNCSLYFHQTTGAILPASIDGAEFVGGTYAIFDATTTTPIEWLTYLETNRIKVTGSADGFAQLDFRFGTTSAISRYIVFIAIANPIVLSTPSTLRGTRIG